MLIKAKSFEIIDNLELNIRQGITVIVGASNNGKSSLIRLLRSVIYNLNGDSSIQQGETSYTIGVIDGDNKIIVKRDANATNKTVYSVNGTVLKKVGRNSIPEVEEALNIKVIDINKKKMELNFLKQMEFPFLVGESGAFIYDFLSSSSNQNDFTDLIKLMKHDLKEASDDKKHLEGRVDTLKDLYQTSKDTYDKVENISPLVTRIIDFDSNMQYLQKLENSIQNLEYADKGIIDINNKLNFYLSEYKIVKDLDDILEDYNKILQLSQNIKDIEALKDKILAQEVSLAKLLSLSKTLDLNILDNLNSELQECSSYCEDLTSKITSIDNIYLTRDRLLSLSKTNENSLTLLKDILSLKDKEMVLQGDISQLQNQIDLTVTLVQNLTDDTLNKNRNIVNLGFIESDINDFDMCPVCGSILKEDKCYE